MPVDRVPAVFIRGGTSKGLFFHARDLPPSREERDEIFLRAIGSPDPYNRQLNGMGGGISSLSKAVVIEPSARDDADVDYTFIQIVVDKPVADYSQACGNLSSAVGPFSVDEGLVDVADGEAVVRVFSTNTEQVYHARFKVKDGRAVESGDFKMAGVAGTGARIRLDYLRPGGARTRAFLPSGSVVDPFEIEGIGRVEVSLVDATNPVVFVDARQFGKSALEMPEVLESDADLMAALDLIRRAGGVRMGMADAPADIPLGNPKVALVGPPETYETTNRQTVAGVNYDIAVRIVSMERFHRAVTGTGAMCLAAACWVTNSMPNRVAGAMKPGADVRIGSPAGVLRVAASVERDDDANWHAERVTVYRTQRRLMEGWVRLPG